MGNHRIAVITPISHLKGVKELINSKGIVFYLETSNKDQVRSLLMEENINTIICNPNQQSYKIDGDLLNNTKVNLINSCSTGLNHIDLDYCKKHNIKIQCHKNDYELINQLPSTSELAFGLMLSLLRKIPDSNIHVKSGGWDYTKFMGRQIKDLNIGIIGYGRLGKMMDRFCKAFEANTFIFDPYVDIQQTSLEEIFKKCDVVSLHVHVNEETKYMINKKLLGLAKNDSYLINTSRGEIVNERDVIDALENGNLSGYGTDVIEDEFNDWVDSPIVDAMRRGQNIICTPHTGGMTIEGQTKAYKWSINKL